MARVRSTAIPGVAVAVALLLGVAGLAVAGGAAGAATGLSSIEFVNAIDAGPVDLRVGGSTVADDVTFGEIVDIGAVAAGAPSVEVRTADGGTVLAAENLTLLAGRVSTVTWYPDAVGGPTLRAFDAPGSTRLLNLSEGPPLAVEISGPIIGAVTIVTPNGESWTAPRYPGVYEARVTRADTGVQVFPPSGVLIVDADPGIDVIAIGDLDGGTFEVISRDPPGVEVTVATGMVNGLPGRSIDVLFDGVPLVEDLAVGVLDDRLVLPRRTLGVEVVPDAGAVIDASIDLGSGPSQDTTIVAHLDATGDPTVSHFVDTPTSSCCLEGRLTVRHVAAAAPLDIELSSGDVFADTANGEQATILLEAGFYTVESPQLGAEPPIEVIVAAGVHTFVHLIGDPGGGTFDALVTTVPRLGAGGRFADVTGSVFEDDVAALAEVGVTYGIRPGYFGAWELLTRDQMAAFLVRALDLPPSSVDAFADDDGTYFEAEINALAAAGVARGRTATTFEPGAPITRAEMAALLVRALAIPSSVVDAFADDDGHFFEDEINALAAAGITNGLAEGVFGPELVIQRGPAAAFVSRALGLT